MFSHCLYGSIVLISIFKNTIDEWRNVFITGATMYMLPVGFYAFFGSAVDQNWIPANTNIWYESTYDVFVVFECIRCVCWWICQFGSHTFSRYTQFWFENIIKLQFNCNFSKMSNKENVDWPKDRLSVKMICWPNKKLKYRWGGYGG